MILKDRFDGEIYYDVIWGHFIVKICGLYYDHTGIVDLSDRKIIKWEEFEKYDNLQKERIVKDCLK